MNLLLLDFLQPNIAIHDAINTMDRKNNTFFIKYNFKIINIQTLNLLK